MWSIAHPQPASVCQPCYCDKVRTRTRTRFHSPLRQPRTDAHLSILLLPHLYPFHFPTVLRPGCKRDRHREHARVLFRLPLLVPRSWPAAAQALALLRSLSRPRVMPFSILHLHPHRLNPDPAACSIATVTTRLQIRTHPPNAPSGAPIIILVYLLTTTSLKANIQCSTAHVLSSS